MNMPGFNAEASLYKTSVPYNAAIERVHTGEAVYAAQFSMFSRIPQFEAYHESSPFVTCLWQCKYFPYVGLICGCW